MSTTATDTLGVAIELHDVVTVISWGGNVRVADCGRKATVTGFTHAGNVTLMSHGFDEGIARGSAVRPACLAVARRDGEPGHEGNRPRCTCGGRDFASCLCNISPNNYARSAR